MDFAKQLKSMVDIVEVVRERVPSLKRQGARPQYKGLCPFHNEKTPSFSVHAGMQSYYCFGCGAKGDVYKFVQEMDHITFYEVVKMLAERNGVPMPKRSEQSDRETRLREALVRMNEIAARIYRSALQGPGGSEVRRYLAERNVKPESIEEFGLGLSDRGGNTVLRALEHEGFSGELLEGSGLVIKREDGSGFFDRFRGRLMFPIHNEAGKVVGFAGRVLEKGKEPKYLNSPETEVYKKSRLLYNMHRAKEPARKEGRFVLVEGYMDVIGLDAAGIRESVASCGTALTNDQVRLMKRFATHVTVNFDPDAGGTRGAEKSIEVMQEETVRVKILELDLDLDPDEYIQQFGVEKYRSMLDKAPSFYFWLADQLRKRYDKTAEGRAQVMQQLLPRIQRIPDRIERAAIAEDLAAFLGVDRGLVLEQFRKSALDNRVQPMKKPGVEVRSVERILLTSLLAHPELRDEVIPMLMEQGLAEQFRLRKVFEMMGQLYENEPQFTYPDLEARLEESDSALLSRVVFADEMQEIEELDQARTNVAACLKTMAEEQRVTRTSELRREIRDAEQRGDMAAALELMQRLDSLKRGKG